jgi:hypothetical protein
MPSPRKTPPKKKPVSRVAEKHKRYEKKDLENELREAEIYFCHRLAARMGHIGRAYKDVYPTAKESSASVEGSKWLRKPKVNAYYKLILLEMQASAKVDTDYLLEKHRQIIEMDITQFFDGKKKYITLKHISQFPKEYRWMIQEISPGPHGVKIKLLDKSKALQALGDIAGITSSTQLAIPGNINISYDKSLEGL